VDATPTAFVVARFWLASLVFLAFSGSARAGAKLLVTAKTKDERRFRKDILVLGAALGGGYILQTVGLLTTTTSKSAFLTSTAVIWTPVFSHLLGREKIDRQLLIAVLVTITGVLLMTKAYNTESIVLGDILTILCAMAFGVYIIWIDRALHHALPIAENEHAATMMVTSTQIVAASVIVLVFLPILETPHLHIGISSGSALVYTALVGTSATAYLQARYQHHLSPTAAAVIYMLEPVVAMIIAELFLTEQIGFVETLGALLIIIGVLIAQFQKKYEV
jgi:drug/metabolite transporter (DMT)-like permease